MYKWLIALALTSGAAFAQEDGPGPNLIIEIAGEANGRVVIDMFDEVAPQHVEQITGLAREGAYDDIAFHRVIAGFMAQTGDVEFGKASDYSIMAGRGGSNRPDLPAEFSDIPYERGIVGMARSQNPNSGNSQFFIMFAPAAGLNGQYTVVGQVIEGMDIVDAIKRGSAAENGVIASDPDRMVTVSVEE